MKISFIGAGNVAWHLAQQFEKKGHIIEFVYSRNENNAESLCKKLYDTKAKSDLNFEESQTEIFILAISDDSLEEVISQIVLPDKAIITHTSGSKSIKVFDKLNEVNLGKSIGTGIFYPLQTFSKEKKIHNFQEIPFCIEGSNEITEKKLLWLAEEISQNVQIVHSAQRKILHISAVFACNFTNHLLALSKEILEKEKLDFALLKPLIQETIQKALTSDPKSVQTGPAKRKDWTVMGEHIIYLHENEYLNHHFSEIYEAMTRSILGIKEA